MVLLQNETVQPALVYSANTASNSKSEARLTQPTKNMEWVKHMLTNFAKILHTCTLDHAVSFMRKPMQSPCLPPRIQQ